MRPSLLALALAALALVFPAAVSGDDLSEKTAIQDRPAPIPLYSPRRLLSSVTGKADEEIVFIDVREPEEFALDHIPGALNIRQRDFARRKGEIPRGATVIPYCNFDFRGFVAARALEELGFTVALMQERGISGWRGQGLPVAGSDAGHSDDDVLAMLSTVSPASLAPDLVAEPVPPSGAIREIEIEAAEWYFEPNDLTVTAGDEVRIRIRSEKGNHFFVMPDYEVETFIPQGQTKEVVFVADRTGVSRFGSCEWDDGVLHKMKGLLRVVDGARQ